MKNSETGILKTRKQVPQGYIRCDSFIVVVLVDDDDDDDEYDDDNVVVGLIHLP